MTLVSALSATLFHVCSRDKAEFGRAGAQSSHEFKGKGQTANGNGSVSCILKDRVMFSHNLIFLNKYFN